MIDCDLDLDVPPVERVAHMLGKGYLYGCHFLPHDALQTRRAGGHSLTNLRKRGWPIEGSAQNPRHLGWYQQLRQMLPRFSFRIPQCERGLEAFAAITRYGRPRPASPGTSLVMTGEPRL